MYLVLYDLAAFDPIKLRVHLPLSWFFHFISIVTCPLCWGRAPDISKEVSALSIVVPSAGKKQKKKFLFNFDSKFFLLSKEVSTLSIVVPSAGQKTEEKSFCLILILIFFLFQKKSLLYLLLSHQRGKNRKNRTKKEKCWSINSFIEEQRETWRRWRLLDLNDYVLVCQ